MHRILFILFLFISSSFASAHQFHVALAKAEYNATEKTMEVTLEIESHDLEHWLEDKGIQVGHIEMVEKNSAIWKKITSEILANFSAKSNVQTLQFSVIGIEVATNGRAFVYVVAENVASFKQIEWTFSLLMDHDDTQQNKLELIVNKKKYYAVFLANKRTALIQLN